MAFTDHSDLFGSVHEDGINLFVRHLMMQRPSLFNYATSAFRRNPCLFCREIPTAPEVRDAGNPLFTEQELLPILGTPGPIGIHFCVQLTAAEVDFHPGSVFELPPELAPLPQQHFALHAQACMGIDCPAKLIDQLVPGIESYLYEQNQLTIFQADDVKPDGDEFPVDEIPPTNILCFCLDVFAVGHFEWGDVAGSDQSWFKARLDGLEIVDLRPERMETSIECYLSSVLRLGVLPRLIVPLETLTLDITEAVSDMGLTIGDEVALTPSDAPADVPNNPAIEDDLLKVFAKLTVTEGGA